MRKPWTPVKCGTNSCVKVSPTNDGGVALTSTLGEDKGSVAYTDDEWRTFIDAVKAGELDHTV